jgi:hypothetical protein
VEGQNILVTNCNWGEGNKTELVQQLQRFCTWGRLSKCCLWRHASTCEDDPFETHSWFWSLSLCVVG